MNTLEIDEYLRRINSRMRKRFDTPDDYHTWLEDVEWKKRLKIPPPIIRTRNNRYTNGFSACDATLVKTMYDYCMWSAPVAKELTRMFKLIKSREYMTFGNLTA